MSDVVIVTSDNPRTEDPAAIISDVLQGISDRSKVIIEADRAKAIQNGIERARPGDIVLIAGKGHEEYQVIGKNKIHFSDKEEVLKRIG